MDKMPAKQRKSAKFRIVIKSYNTRARKSTGIDMKLMD